MEKKEVTTRFDFIENDKRIIDQRLRKHEISTTEHQRILKAVVDDKDLFEDVQVFKDSIPES